VRLGIELAQDLVHQRKDSDYFVVSLVPGEVNTNNVLSLSRAHRDVVGTDHPALGYLNEVSKCVPKLVEFLHYISVLTVRNVEF